MMEKIFARVAWRGVGPIEKSTGGRGGSGVFAHTGRSDRDRDSTDH